MSERIMQSFVSVTPTIQAAAYAAGDVIGGKMTFTNLLSPDVPTGELRKVYIYDKAKQGVSLTLVLFSADPSATTFTENAALTLNAADLEKVIAVVPLTTHLALAANGVTYADEIAKSIKVAQSVRTIYGCLLAVGTPTYTSTSDLTVTLGFMQD